MKNNNIDVFVSGAGLAGLIASIAFARNGFSVVCVDKNKSEFYKKTQKNTYRTTAFLEPSKKFLDEIGIWVSLEKYSCPMQSLKIVDTKISNEKLNIKTDKTFSNDNVNDMLIKNGIEGIPIFNVENACASGSSGFYLANQMLKSGACDIALVVGAEKMNVADKAKMFSVFDGAWDVSNPEQNLKTLLKPAEGFEVPPGTTSERPYSVFMDVYAAFCRNHMKTFGTTQRQIAAVSAKNHQHSVHNELSQFRDPYTIDEVMAAPPITYPLTLPMCAPISDAFSNKQIFNSELSCFNLIAVASPDGPPPTITTSYSIVSLDILNFLQIILFLYSV